MTLVGTIPQTSADFQWQIERWSERGRKEIASPKFSFAGSKWWLELDSWNRLKFYRFETSEETVRCWLGMRMADGAEKEVGSCVLEPGSDDPQWYMHMSAVSEDQLAPSDTLTIVVRMRTGPDAVKSICPHSPHEDKSLSHECGKGTLCLPFYPNSLSRDLSELLESQVLPDVILRCGDRDLPAHRAILAARSKVFSAMFQSKMSEGESGVVDIADLDVRVLELFLKYVYSGKILDVSDDALPGLYAAGDKYAVGALARACSARLVENLTQENCLGVLSLADSHSDQQFKNATVDFILNNPEVIKGEAWNAFTKENPALSSEIVDTGGVTVE